MGLREADAMTNQSEVSRSHTGSVHRPWVILVHGLAAHRSALIPLAWRLSRRGFRTIRYGYPSIVGPVTGHAARFDRFLEQFEQRERPDSFHLVVHSMGGLVTRALLERRQPQSLHRVVMLGTPNQGSHAARKLAPWLGRICHPLREIGDRPTDWVARLGGVGEIETGVIAGTRDRVVTVDATWLDGIRDHQTVRSGHGELLFRRDVARMVANFLEQGRFVPEENTNQGSRAMLPKLPELSFKPMQSSNGVGA